MRLFGGKKFIPGVKIEVDTENLEDSTIKKNVVIGSLGDK